MFLNFIHSRSGAWRGEEEWTISNARNCILCPISICAIHPAFSQKISFLLFYCSCLYLFPISNMCFVPVSVSSMLFVVSLKPQGLEPKNIFKHHDRILRTITCLLWMSLNPWQLPKGWQMAKEFLSWANCKRRWKMLFFTKDMLSFKTQSITLL